MTDPTPIRLNRQRSRHAFLAHPMFAMADEMLCREKLGLPVEPWRKRDAEAAENEVRFEVAPLSPKWRSGRENEG